MLTSLVVYPAAIVIVPQKLAGTWLLGTARATGRGASSIDCPLFALNVT